MRLTLIRHGQTPSNVASRLDTARPGAGLTELGLAQAATLVRALDGQPIDAIFASTLVRTQLTAAPLAADRGLSVVVRDGLREVDAAGLEMNGDDESRRAYRDTVFGWAAGDLALRMPGGVVDGAATLAAFDEVIDEIAAVGAEHTVIVSHGSVIRLWIAARADNVAADWARDHPLGNTGIAVVQGDPTRGWHMVEWAGVDLGDPVGPAADR